MMYTQMLQYLPYNAPVYTLNFWQNTDDDFRMRGYA